MKSLRLLSSIMLCLLPRFLAAQPLPGPLEATRRRTLILDSEAAQHAGNHDLALQRALDAAAIQMTPSLRRFIAEEYEALGRYRLASFHATTCVSEARANVALNNRDAIIQHCEDLSTRLQMTGAWLRLPNAERAPSGARVVVEGEDLARESWGEEVLVRAGPAVVRAEMPDGLSVERRVTLVAGAHRAVDLPWGLLRRDTAAVVSRSDSGVPTTSVRGPGAGPWVLVGIGAAALGTAALVYALVVGPNEDTIRTCIGHQRSSPIQSCPLMVGTSNVLDTYETRQIGLTVTNVALGVGGATIVGGLLWYFLSPRETAPRFSISAVVTPEGGLVRVGGRL